MKMLRISNLARIVVISMFTVMMLFPVVLTLNAQSIQISPNPNPAGNTIQTPFDVTTPFPNPPAVTAHNNIDFTNNGKVELFASFDNNGTFNNNGTLTDIMQFIDHNNNAGAVWNNNAGANMDNGNGHFHNAAGAVFNNYGTYTNAGQVFNYGTITNHAGGYYRNGVQTWNYNTFVNNGTYEGWIYRNYAGTTTNNGTWIHHSGIVWNYAGGAFYNNGRMTTEQWYNSTLGIRNEGAFYNNTPGVIDNGTGMMFENKTGGTFNNAGTINNNGIMTNESGAVFNNSGTLTNNATVNNSGTLVNAGTLNNAGTFNNSGTMTSTGQLNNTGTFNNAKTVELAAGSTYNFTGGTFNNNNGALLVLNRDFNFDSGTVNLNAGSTLQNNAVLNNPAGHVQVNNGTFVNGSGGTFINNGVLTTSTVFTNNGRFQGTGTTNGDVINNGTIAPGNSIGTMSINSAYVHNAGATYEVEINGSGQSDRVVTNGMATLKGGTVLVIPSGVFLAGTPYTYNILSAAGGVTGAFANLTTTSAFLADMYLTYLPRDVNLTFTRRAFQTVCETENQCQASDGLEASYPAASGDMRDILGRILLMNAYEARSAYDQMSGYIHTAIPAVTFSSYNRYRNMMAARMAGFVSGSPSSALAVRPVMFSLRTGTGNDAQNTLLAVANSTAPVNSTKTPTWGFWMDAYGSLNERRASDISSRYDYNTAGVIFGFDRKITPSLLLGGSAGYSYTRADLKDLSEDARISSYQGSLYGIYTKGPWYVSGIGSYAYNAYDTSRNMAFGTVARSATASYAGHLIAGYIEGGYKLATKYADVIPFAAFQATYLTRGTFTEDGAGALDLDADKENTTSYLASLGVRLKKDFTIAAGTLSPELRVRWDHELSNDKHSLRASFAGYPQSAFTVSADRPDRDRLTAGVGITLKTKGNLYLNLSYDGYFSNDTTQHSGMLGLQYKF